MNAPQTYFSKIPQSVLIAGRERCALAQFSEAWAARLLQTDIETIQQHPDFHALHPANKMRQISVDAIRQFNQDVYITPFQSIRKVGIIYDADRLNGTAANALLKTLEEPPNNTSLFLLTTRPYDLLLTLRSRCWWVSIDTNYSEVDADLAAWLTDFKQYTTTRLIEQAPPSPLISYGLLYHRLQTYLTQKTEEPDTRITSIAVAEETAAQKATLERQIWQQIFESMEETLSAIVREHPLVADVCSTYAQWISNLECCYRRIEFNFGVLPALESFLLAL